MAKQSGTFSRLHARLPGLSTVFTYSGKKPTRLVGGGSGHRPGHGAVKAATKGEVNAEVGGANANKKATVG